VLISAADFAITRGKIFLSFDSDWRLQTPLRSAQRVLAQVEISRPAARGETQKIQPVSDGEI